MVVEVALLVDMAEEIKEDLQVTTWTSNLQVKIWEEAQQEFLLDRDHLVLDKVHHQDMEAQWEEGLDQDHIEDHHQAECPLIWTLSRGHLVQVICLEEMIL